MDECCTHTSTEQLRAITTEHVASGTSADLSDGLPASRHSFHRRPGVAHWRRRGPGPRRSPGPQRRSRAEQTRHQGFQTQTGFAQAGVVWTHSPPHMTIWVT